MLYDFNQIALYEPFVVLCFLLSNNVTANVFFCYHGVGETAKVRVV